MDNNISHGTGVFSTALSLGASILTWITLKDAQIILAMAASVVAIASGIFAIRYYYLATKKQPSKP
jgi:hypothetical protein